MLDYPRTVTESSDAELLGRWRDGDRRAGEALFDRYFDALYRFFRGKVGVAADDLVQRTLLACLNKASTLREDAAFRGFLFGIARFELLHYFREQGRARARELDAGSEVARSLADLDPSPSQVLVQGAERKALARALRKLPLDLQLVLELTYWEHLTSAEVAQALGIAEGTVKSRIRRAREGLVRLLEQQELPAALHESTVGGLETWVRELRDFHGPS